MEASRVHRPGYETPTKPRKQLLDKPRLQKYEQLPSSKRQRPATTNAKPKALIDLTGDTADEDDVVVTKAKKKKKAPSESSTSERRARRFRNHPPQSYLEKLDRARTQKMFVLRRTRGGTADVPEESVDMVGTTGNLYTVTISSKPSCSCPDAKKGNQCKHVVYVLVNVLKAREDLQYQLAFLSSELQEIFENAPPIKPAGTGSADTDDPGNRKPIEGDCPICFMEFDAQNEQIVWCKAACGNNIHKTCFSQWAATSGKRKVQCVYCRSEWLTEAGDFNAESLLQTERTVGEDGYVNVAAEVGLSGERDYSSYHQFWVNRHLGRGRYGSRYYPY
ncbi:uncharacterized protein TRUGW13939_03469 [Talaromyces rugulosus]|uniref:Anaphase-promoting complex subunit 11 n=1 Tax=Talaromyces rugulosus TaxID=121627 RepID=A0A7H8QR48_TALRU|nr:uncharacterized protein TRUGW13939_03469 [Talaromyces rugulosus]QKX56368.1 hypothetical protein TRUGW13939_03469 [Talaromyces rugulosus]